MNQKSASSSLLSIKQQRDVLRNAFAAGDARNESLAGTKGILKLARQEVDHTNQLAEKALLRLQ